MENNLLKNIPISLSLAIVNIIIFSLYLTTAFKHIPCNKDAISIFWCNFIHIEPSHLMANLYALYALSRVERDIGSKKFTALIIFLLIFNSIMETIMHKIFPTIPYAIGFSGVLFGIMTWEIVSKQKLDMVLVSSIAAMVIIPSMKNSNTSFMGHSIGAISGIIGGLLWKKRGLKTNFSSK